MTLDEITFNQLEVDEMLFNTNKLSKVNTAKAIFAELEKEKIPTTEYEKFEYVRWEDVEQIFKEWCGENDE